MGRPPVAGGESIDVRIGLNAKDDIRFICSNVGSKFREQVKNKLRSVAQNPELGDPLPEFGPGVRDVKISGRYRGIYRWDPDTNTVLLCAVGIRKEGSTQDVYEVARRKGLEEL